MVIIPDLITATKVEMPIIKEKIIRIRMVKVLFYFRVIPMEKGLIPI